jgi:hypothetical protein
MILFRLARAQWPRVAAGLLAVAALVAACGGSTTQYEPFIAERVFAFGDETSVLTGSPAGNGLKYSINGLDNDGNVDCRLNLTWVQSVASLYGFVPAECNPNGLEPKSYIFAEAGATVDDVTRQVERAALQVDRRFGDKDLATMLAGANDILELYARYPAESRDALLNEARSRGVQLARAVNALVALGARVVVSDVPSLGLTPFARKERALHTDTDRALLLTPARRALYRPGAGRPAVPGDQRQPGELERDGRGLHRGGAAVQHRHPGARRRRVHAPVGRRYPHVQFRAVATGHAGHRPREPQPVLTVQAGGAERRLRSSSTFTARMVAESASVTALAATIGHSRSARP